MNLEKPKEETHEERVAKREEEEKRLVAGYQGDFFFAEERYEEALKQYQLAERKDKIRELGERCLLRGESKAAIDAYAALGETLSEPQLRKCVERCLKEGRLADGLVACKELYKVIGDLDWPEVGEDPSAEIHVALVDIDPDLFLECGDACRERMERVKENKEKWLQDAVRAYEIARRPDRIVGLAHGLLRELQSLPQKEKAKALYERAADLELSKKAVEKVGKELEEMAKDAAKSEEENGPLPLVGRTSKMSREPLIVEIPSTISLVIEQVRREQGEVRVDANTPEEEIELTRVLTPGSEKKPPEEE